MENIKILIAEDHQIVTDGIKALLEGVEGITVVGEAKDGRECIEKLEQQQVKRQQDPASPDAIGDESGVDIILMDIDMPVMNGYQATKLIQNKYPSVKVLALTMYNEKSLITKMLKAGAYGYILKNIDKEELLEAIKMVNNGENYYSNEIPLTLSRPASEDILAKKQEDILISQLTQRELEVLELIAQGLSNNQIGEKLFISPRTVDTHRTNLMQKLNVHNIAGLIKVAIQNGLMD
ncbi:MAG: response regulator transcription factor [Cytophagales bacterium]|nr:response regulator transcription factor [Cytophagales bacterium]